jgi:hypothetical protein
MSRLRIMLDDNQMLGCDLETDDKPLSEILLLLSESMASIEKQECPEWTDHEQCDYSGMGTKSD